MATREIWHEILVNVSPERLYRAVSDPKMIAHWWTTGARGESAIGRQLEFWFGDYRGSVAEVTVLKQNECVRWRIVGGGVEDWIGTEIEFAIFREREQTVLHFRHSGWKEHAKLFPHCSLGWAVFLLSLKEFTETGKGRPYPYDMPVNLWAPPPASASESSA